MSRRVIDREGLGPVGAEIEELRVAMRSGETHVCVRISGELDVSSADVLRDVLDAAVATEAGDVAVDMSTTTFCDSTGLRALLTARRQLLVSGRRMRIVEASRPVLRLLELSGTRRLVGPLPSDQPDWTEVDPVAEPDPQAEGS